MALLRPDANVDRVRQDGFSVNIGTLAKHAIEDLAQACPLVFTEIREEHAWNRVAVKHPFPHFLPRGKFRPLGRALNTDVLQSRIFQSLTQDLRVGYLELERGRIVWNTRELGSYGRKRAK